MLTVLRLHWSTVDDLQWELVRALLSTERLAPHGCLSAHLRRTGTDLRMSALWDDTYGAAAFCLGPLPELLSLIGLDRPVLTEERLPGTYATSRRPVEQAPVEVLEVEEERRAA